MATTGKILGQANLALAATDVTLYTVPGATQAQTSRLIIKNVTGTQAIATVWLRVNNAAKTNAQIVIGGLDGTIPANSRGIYLDNWTLNAGDVVTVQSDTANALSFSLFGLEIA